MNLPNLIASDDDQVIFILNKGLERFDVVGDQRFLRERQIFTHPAPERFSLRFRVLELVCCSVSIYLQYLQIISDRFFAEKLAILFAAGGRFIVYDLNFSAIPKSSDQCPLQRISLNKRPIIDGSVVGQYSNFHNNAIILFKYLVLCAQSHFSFPYYRFNRLLTTNAPYDFTKS